MVTKLSYGVEYVGGRAVPNPDLLLVVNESEGPPYLGVVRCMDASRAKFRVTSALHQSPMELGDYGSEAEAIDVLLLHARHVLERRRLRILEPVRSMPIPRDPLSSDPTVMF